MRPILFMSLEDKRDNLFPRILFMSLEDKTGPAEPVRLVRPYPDQFLNLVAFFLI